MLRAGGVRRGAAAEDRHGHAEQGRESSHRSQRPSKFLQRGQLVRARFVHVDKDDSRAARKGCRAESPSTAGRQLQMKLVIGIVRPEKTNEVLEALYRAEVRGFSMSRVQGHGGELDRVETYRGTTVRVGLTEKVRFEIAVSDEFVRARDRGAVLRRPDRRGRRRQDLRARPRAGRAHPDRARPTTRRSRRWAPDGAGSRHGRHRLDARRHRAGAADDAGAGPVLRGPGALQEHAEHVHDVRRRAGRGDDHVGADRLLVRVLGGQRLHRRLRPRVPARRRLRAA